MTNYKILIGNSIYLMEMLNGNAVFPSSPVSIELLIFKFSTSFTRKNLAGKTYLFLK